MDDRLYCFYLKNVSNVLVLFVIEYYFDVIVYINLIIM